MKWADMVEAPVRTTAICKPRANEYARDAATAFEVRHFEKVTRGIKVIKFYGPTPEEATAKAAEHDRKRKEQFIRWQESAKERRKTLKK